MNALNNTLHYKASIDVKSREGDGDALWSLICTIRHWMTDKWLQKGVEIPHENEIWSQLKMGSSIQSEDTEGTVRLQSKACWSGKPRKHWACKITETEKAKGRASREWVTDIGFSYAEASHGTVSIVVSFSDQPGYLGERQDEPEMSVPEIISRLARSKWLSCEVCGMPLELGARKLNVGDYPSFWSVLSNAAREVYVIYVSPENHVGGRQFAVDPQEIAACLGSSAIVFFSNDAAFSDELREMLPNKDYTCYDGAVRIYLPGLRADDPDDPRRHRYFTSGYIDEMGDKGFIRMLWRAIAQDVRPDEKMVTVDAVRDEARRSIEERRARGRIKETEEAFLELASESKGEGERTRLKIDELESEIYSLRAQLQTMKHSFNDRKSPVVCGNDLGWYSSRALAEAFLISYVDRIDFTERALKSLDDCDTHPKILWDALYALCTVAYELYTSPGGTDITKEFNSRTKFEYARGAGTMTRKDSKLIEQYKDTYDGREIEAEEHIKKGNDKSPSGQSIRVYFCFDSTSKKIIISHVGRHLKVYSSQFLS